MAAAAGERPAQRRRGKAAPCCASPRRCSSLQALFLSTLALISLLMLAAAKSRLAEEGALASPAGRGAAAPAVTASIAVHPPKFHHVGLFLEQYAACTAAMESMAVLVVFSDEDDEQLFRKGLSILHPSVPQTAFTSAVADVNSDQFLESLHIPNTNTKQVVAAWKKWFGIAHLLDLGHNGGEYGLMLDAEVLLYNTSDCGVGSHWHDLLQRVQRKDAAKLWPAARLSKTMKREPLGDGNFRTGFGHGQGVIKGNADFITHGGCDMRKNKLKGCETPECLEVNRQIELALFSWWTELPFVNLRTAGRMLRALNEKGCPRCYPVKDGSTSWRRLLRGIRFPRFEYICYQQWCVLQEGYHFNDVTDITGEAKWGSFLEDPMGKDADLARLEPLWVSAECVAKAEAGKIRALSRTAPPLLVFHVDHVDRRFGVGKWEAAWREKVPGFEAQVAFSTREHNTARVGGFVNVSFISGSWNVDFDWESGRVTRIYPGPARSLGVREGWVIKFVDGITYSRAALEGKFNSPDGYVVTFLTEKASEDILPEPLTGLSQAQCQERCLKDGTCECVTFGRLKRKQAGRCWMHRRCNPTKFGPDMDTNVFMKKPGLKQHR